MKQEIPVRKAKTSFIMTDYYECIYNAAIALNNTAIHLVQHGKYFEASETLQDAMKCTKVFCNGGSSVDLPFVMPRAECERALHAARVRKNRIQVDGSAAIISSKYPNDILVVSDQDDPQEVYYTLEQNRSLRCCVTIDPVEKFELHDVDRLQVESALIVYNFGVVYRCMASRPVALSLVKFNDNDEAITHFDVYCASVRILELTRCVTTNLLSVLSCNGTRSLHISSNLLLAAVLVLTNLNQMSVESYSLHETHQYYNVELANILEMISEREMFFISEGYQVSVALAA